jgi:hypothetical protein
MTFATRLSPTGCCNGIVMASTPRPGYRTWRPNLGHKDIVSTLVYLNITPDLLQQASERYRQRGADALCASGGRS